MKTGNPTHRLLSCAANYQNANIFLTNCEPNPNSRPSISSPQIPHGGPKIHTHIHTHTLLISHFSFLIGEEERTRVALKTTFLWFAAIAIGYGVGNTFQLLLLLLSRRTLVLEVYYTARLVDRFWRLTCLTVILHAMIFSFTASHSRSPRSPFNASLTYWTIMPCTCAAKGSHRIESGGGVPTLVARSPSLPVSQPFLPSLVWGQTLEPVPAATFLAWIIICCAKPKIYGLRRRNVPSLPQTAASLASWVPLGAAVASSFAIICDWYYLLVVLASACPGRRRYASWMGRYAWLSPGLSGVVAYKYHLGAVPA